MKTIAILAAAALLLPAVASAQNTNVNGNRANSQSNSGAVSGSSSGATAATNGNTQGITFNNPTPSNTNYSNGTISGDQTIRNAPTVYAPPVSGGNPCTLAISGGASFLGWGAAAGGTFVDEDCANRQKIAMIHNAGYAAIAFELMCNDRATYNAVKAAVNQPGVRQCAFRSQFEPSGAAPVQQPAVVPVSAPTPVPVVQRVIPGPTNLPRCTGAVRDNCYSG